MNFDTYKDNGKDMIYYEIKDYLKKGFYNSAIKIILYYFYPNSSDKIKNIDNVVNYIIKHYMRENPRLRFLIDNDIGKIIFDIGIILKVDNGILRVKESFFSYETNILSDFFGTRRIKKLK